MLNYVRLKTGAEVHFEDADDLASARALAAVQRAGGSVYRRPDRTPWRRIQQILGEYECAVGDLARRRRPDRTYTFRPDQCSCSKCKGKR